MNNTPITPTESEEVNPQANPVSVSSTPVTDVPKNKFNRTIISLIVLAILVGGGLGGGMVYYLGQNKDDANTNMNHSSMTMTPTPTATSTPAVSPTPTPSSESTSGWKTYSATNPGFSFKYPSNYHADDCGISAGNPAMQDLICMSDLSESTPANDALFNGFHVHTHLNPEHTTVELYASDAEQQARNTYKTRTGLDATESVKQENLTVADKPAISVYYPWLKMREVYIEASSSNPMLIISMTEESTGSFPEFDQILTTFSIPFAAGVGN